MKDEIIIYNNLYLRKNYKVSFSTSEEHKKEKILLILEKEKFQTLKDLEQNTGIFIPELNNLLTALIYETKIMENKPICLKTCKVNKKM